MRSRKLVLLSSPIAQNYFPSKLKFEITFGCEILLFLPELQIDPMHALSSRQDEIQGTVPQNFLWL